MTYVNPHSRMTKSGKITSVTSHIRKYPEKMLRLWTKDVSFGGTGEKTLTNSFLILEKSLNGPSVESELVHSKGERMALRKLIDEKLISRIKTVKYPSKRNIFVYHPTRLGLEMYVKMREKYFKDVKPKVIK